MRLCRQHEKDASFSLGWCLNVYVLAEGEYLSNKRASVQSDLPSVHKCAWKANLHARKGFWCVYLLLHPGKNACARSITFSKTWKLLVFHISHNLFVPDLLEIRVLSASMDNTPCHMHYHLAPVFLPRCRVFDREWETPICFVFFVLESWNTTGNQVARRSLFNRSSYKISFLAIVFDFCIVSGKRCS
jgi:hypothetical protein